MLRPRKIRFVEPGGRRGRPFNAWIARWPLLGPITLATILHHKGYDVGVINENISGSVEDHDELLGDLCSSDVVGISIMTPTAARGYAIADRIKAQAPHVTVVFGGVHATFRPEEALAHGDLVVRGEGEAVIEAVASGELRGGIVRSVPLADLDELPTLDHGLMRDFDKLLARCRRRELYELPVMTSRGCPNGCTYCSVTQMFGHQVRRQSVSKVYRDVCAYADRGFQHLFFYDDNFTTDRRWTRQLLEHLGPMRMRFNAQARVDFAWRDRDRRQRDEQLLRAMRRSGGDVLYVGYETVDDATARHWNKGYRGSGALADRLREDTRILHDSGFWIHGMFILGPQHTRATADNIVHFARQAEIETIQISVLTPFPGTRLLEEMRPHLFLADYPRDWDFYDGTHCVYNNGRLSVEALQRTLLKAHDRFYRWGWWRPRRLRSVLEERSSPLDKLAHLRDHIRIARTTLREWRSEIDTFLDMVRQRTHKWADRLRERPGEMEQGLT